MASYTMTIANGVNCFGPGPSVKWGNSVYPYTMTWGVSLWGEPESLEISFIKVISNDQPIDGAELSRRFTSRVTIGTFIISGDLSSDYLRDGSNSWTYVFTDRVSNAVDRVSATWNESTRNDVTFTCLPGGSTTWSSQ